MSVDEQLLYESRVRNRYAIIAAAAAVLLVAAAVVQISGPHTKVNELTLDLITAHKRFPLDLVGAILNGLGLVALGVTLTFLFGLTRARNPELRNFVGGVAIVGAVLAAVSGIVYSAAISNAADSFVSGGAQTYEQANHLTNSGALLALPFVGQAAALALAVGFVLTALQAMRVGLLTRFLGYLGIFTGVLVLFPIGSPVPVVQAFWLLALAYLLTGRWPNGVPPSWRSGQAEPWPSSAQMREQRAKAANARGGGGRGAPARQKAKAEAAEEPVATAVQPRTRSTTPKRKRKRRN